MDTAEAVPRSMIEKILITAARNLPVPSSSAPCSVVVVQGKLRDQLSEKMLEEFDAGKDGKHDYQKGIKENPERLKRAIDTYAQEFYTGHFGLERSDKDGRRLKYRPNYAFWGAPVVVLLSLPTSAAHGDFLKLGAFMYSVLLGMHAHGLGGKPMGSVAKYPHLVRS